MSQSNLQQFVMSLAVFTVLLFGGLLYIYSDISKTKVEPSTQNTEDVSTTSPIRVEEGDGGYTIEQVPIIPENTPSLTKKITVSSEFSTDAKKLFIEKIDAQRKILLDKPDSMKDWNELALLYSALNLYEDAGEVWEFISEAAPTNSLSFHNLGNLYHYHLKDYPKSELNFLTSIKNDQTFIPAYNGLHELYRYSYRTETNKAVEILELGLEARPNTLEFLVQLGAYYKDKGDMTKARSYYDKALKQAKALNDLAAIQGIQQAINNLK